MFISSPESPFVQFLTYFPLTAPIRLCFVTHSDLAIWEATIAIGIMAVLAVLVLMIAVRVFKCSALEYSRTLSVGEILDPR